MIYDIKHDGHHHARLVAVGYLIGIPIDSVYSIAVSLKDYQILMFASELNGLTAGPTDVPSASLEAFTLKRCASLLD